ncbi:MAG: T9SS type A sorting domain-containing protein [Bacteroidota bacterium]|nr:T9SS type A sorting domain-containing protein [Bacteroidota bacterium]MDP4237260.1 T9SS type A sorting domain-containing protein [Bacteroidota bacterium]
MLNRLLIVLLLTPAAALGQHWKSSGRNVFIHANYSRGHISWEALLTSASDFYIQPTSINEIDTDLCVALYNKGSSYDQGMMYRQAYDTLRKYIELCAMQPKSWGEFLSIEGALDDMDTNRFRYVDAREWFKKVLYYNSDTNYYCADVDGILHTFQYFEGRGNDQLGSLAVLQYIKDVHKCSSWYYMRNYDTLFANTINYVINMWRDTVKDSLKTPLDTTLPSIDELGLGILRGQSKVDATKGLANDALRDLSLVENPFRTEAILRYRLNHGAMVRVDVYDALGRQMSGEGEGYKHAGAYQTSFDARSWPSGTYFIRVSTMGGEVQTIKAIKE